MRYQSLSTWQKWGFVAATIVVILSVFQALLFYGCDLISKDINCASYSSITPYTHGSLILSRLNFDVNWVQDSLNSISDWPEYLGGPTIRLIDMIFNAISIFILASILGAIIDKLYFKSSSSG